MTVSSSNLNGPSMRPIEHFLEVFVNYIWVFCAEYMLHEFGFSGVRRSKPSRIPLMRMCANALSG